MCGGEELPPTVGDVLSKFCDVVTWLDTYLNRLHGQVMESIEMGMVTRDPSFAFC